MFSRKKTRYFLILINSISISRTFFSMQMYQRPFPVPVPIPLPIPVPIFVPTTRNSTRGVKKFLRKMKAKLPDNVFEAQILEMAGALDDKNDPMDSDDSPWEG